MFFFAVRSEASLSCASTLSCFVVASHNKAVFAV
jgi:hypothetical protein